MIYFICLFAAGVIIFPIYIIRAQLTSTSRYADKLYKKAKSKGYEATATLKRSYEPSLENPQNYIDRQQLGKYSFEYNGRTYNIRLWFNDDPPYEIQVYWLYSPRKASTRGAIRTRMWPWLVAYLIIFFIVLSIVT